MGENRSRDWLNQAIEDLKWGRDSLQKGHCAQTCFIAQQVGEKALKALALHRNAAEVRSHSIVAIAKALKVNDEIERAGKRLDQYYISSRYPDAFPEGAPSDFFTEDQAEEALKLAELILNKARAELSHA